jgi:hypothetical protein
VATMLDGMHKVCTAFVRTFIRLGKEDEQKELISDGRYGQ